MTTSGKKPAITKPKINPIRPSMRDKKRYIAFEIESAQPLGFDVDKKLIAKMNELLGVFMASEAAILRVKYNAKNGRGLFKIDRKFVDHAKSCFVMIKTIDNVDVRVRALYVSGMLNKAAKYIELKK